MTRNLSISFFLVLLLGISAFAQEAVDTPAQPDTTGQEQAAAAVSPSESQASTTQADDAKDAAPAEPTQAEKDLSLIHI